MSDEISDADRLGRLEGIQRHLQSIEGKFPYLHLPNLFAADPVAEPPYIVSSSFIPESIGGNIRVIERQKNGDYAPLDTENLEQMLGSFLPGGYKQRWKFYLWQGEWDIVRDRQGYADIEPMFEFRENHQLEDLLGTDTEDFTGMGLSTDAVSVYVPQAMYVSRLPKSTEYQWHIGLQNIVADREPMGETLSLGSSDPTTNYLWFRYHLEEFSGDRTAFDESSLVDGYRFEPDTEFLRCYYASLLTLYEKENNDTLSRTLRYEHGTDDTDAFVGARERSQLLLFELDREEIRDRIERVFSEHLDIKRDLQFSLLYREVWDRLFFTEEILEHVFLVDPFVKHLLGADFWCRDTNSYDAESVFDLSMGDLESILEDLLGPEDSGGRLTLMGYEEARSSDVLAILRKHPDLIEALLDTCSDDDALRDFAEEVVIHSVEHALSTWANEETPAGGSFELWYDVNFQQRDDSVAHAGIYDSIQGGAGIATEVHDYLGTDDIELDSGVGSQAACHTAAADLTAIELLAEGDGDVLYNLFEEQRPEPTNAAEDTESSKSSDDSSGQDHPGDGVASATGFRGEVVDARDAVLGETTDGYNLSDLTTLAENRVRSLFETRETARFYAYVAEQYEAVEETVGRTPRSVDLLLHLDRDIIRDPRVRETYQRFAQGTQRRDLSELGERLEELTMQCVTACPDCLETEESDCVHGMKYQSELLNRRLLREVCLD
ncbi:hypothetical protein PM038_17185 [Halorubrum ezzemoulense]|uniref:hypothetical protein n=1 Tax=Halorubrum ezzemoulense TaxID=337243 RepID=UPI00232C1083|nr:hypothetical protein [Halorubrum ezzemoulense]MDB2286955.1 hypothetical protein [Halorubrum ezzemoulense]